MIRHIDHKVMTEGIKNIEARIVGPDDLEDGVIRSTSVRGSTG